MKKQFEEAEIEILELEQEDVICTSGVGDIDPLQPGTDPWA